MRSKSGGHAETEGWSRGEIVAVFATGVLFCVGVAVRWEPLNGVVALTNWEWSWRSASLGKVAAMLFIPGAIVAAIAAASEGIAGSTAKLRAAVAGLALCNLALQILEVLTDPRGFAALRDVIASPLATSYYTDALGIWRISDWLRSFPLQPLHLHSATHPPGPVLFYYVFIQAFGVSAGALAAAVVIGALGSLAVAVMYWFAGLWTQDRRARLLASAFYALLPAVTVFFPEFDQAYPLLAMLMILLWARALRGSYADAALLGFIGFVSTFFAYNLLTIGAFLALYAVYEWRQGSRLSRLIAAASMAIAMWGSCYVVLWSTTGFDPIAAFHSALKHQAQLAQILQRSHAGCSLFDPYDFAMAAGVIIVPIVVCYLRQAQRAGGMRHDVVLTIMGVATVMIVDVSGLLRAEAARVWMFLQPLWVVPVGLELARLSARGRFAVFGLQWAILICLAARMAFVLP